jgi:hypothetical protein
VNITYYPLYLAFYSAPAPLTYYEYYSRSPTRINPHDATFPGPSLPVVRKFDLPYGSVTFESPSLVEVQFTLLSMPGMCKTGLYFTNQSTDFVALSPSTNVTVPFCKLSNYDDKCFVFAAPAPQNISVRLRAEDAKDTVFIYTSFWNYTAHASPRLTVSGVFGDETEPPVVRLVTSRETPPDMVQVEMATALPRTFTGASEVVIPRHKEPECAKERKWYSEELVVVLLVVSSCLLVLGVVVVVYQIVNRTRKKDLDSRQ